MPTVYGRVKPKSGVEKFYRCSLLFTALWAKFEVDSATKLRLDAEQMIEVTETKPKDYVEPAVDAELVTNVAEPADTPVADAAGGADTSQNNDAVGSDTPSDSTATATATSEATGAQQEANPPADTPVGDAAGGADTSQNNDAAGSDTTSDTPATATETSVATGDQQETNPPADANVPGTSKDTDPIAALVTIIAGLDKANAQLWRKDGSPTTAALGEGVSAKDRDAAWAAFNASGTN